MKPIEVIPGVYWVGAIDWNIRDFHGYATPNGTTYNAFLIMDDKITLLDTVKPEKFDEMLERIRQVVDPKKIDYVISNHTEMDHSGGLPRMMHLIGGNKQVYCSKLGERNLKAHFGDALNCQVLENGGKLYLGKRTLNFFETRMIHWPDSMFSYCPEDKMLFSSDAFGQHYASLERYDDQVGDTIWPHALKYYANIITPFSPLVLKVLESVREMGLDIQTICPDHGVMWRKNPGAIVEAYSRWAKQEPQRKAVVVYDTMWQSTRKMADCIAESLGQEGVYVRLMHLRSTHRSDVIAELQEAGAVIVGSPTINNQMFPTVADFLCYMKGLRPRNKVAAAFGSYGWSGEAVKQVYKELEDCKFDLVRPGVTALFRPTEEAIEACYELGRQVAAKLPPA